MSFNIVHETEANIILKTVIIDYDPADEGAPLREFIRDEFGPISYNILSNIDIDGKSQITIEYEDD